MERGWGVSLSSCIPNTGLSLFLSYLSCLLAPESGIPLPSDKREISYNGMQQYNLAVCDTVPLFQSTCLLFSLLVPTYYLPLPQIIWYIAHLICTPHSTHLRFAPSAGLLPTVVLNHGSLVVRPLTWTRTPRRCPALPPVCRFSSTLHPRLEPRVPISTSSLMMSTPRRCSCWPSSW